MKNMDMKNYRTSKLDKDIIVPIILILALIATALTNHAERKQIITKAQHAIAERDQYINDLEFFIDQIYQPAYHDSNWKTM